MSIKVFKEKEQCVNQDLVHIPAMKNNHVRLYKMLICKNINRQDACRELYAV